MVAEVMMAPATGATCFYQWDLNQQLSVTGDVTEIHFAQPNGTTALVMPVENGLATIPNILLQNSVALTAYAYTPNRTLTTKSWRIVVRQKPEDYVYTETEVKTWGTIEAEAANAIAVARGVRDDFDMLIEDIAADITAAEDAKSALDSAITSANTAKTNLTNATSAGDTARGKLETANTNANTAKTNVDNSTSAANTAKTNLDGSVKTANTSKSNLDGSITDANTAKGELDDTIADAGTSKTNLETATDTANTSKTNLEAATNNANDAKTNADTARTNLQNVIDDSITKKTALQGVIDSAIAINNTLGTTNETASTAKTNLETAIDNASTVKSQLEQVITDATAINSTLNGTISQAETTRSEVQSVINTGNTLQATLTEQNTAAGNNLAALQSENFNSREILTGVDDIKAYIGYTDEDIVGIQVDYENKSFQRLSGAYDLSAGVDFDKYAMFGGRKRCTVADDGTIVTWFGDADYAEDGTMGQVMVYQPKFYYKVVPLKTDQITDGIGHHLRKANYYVSTKPKTGFKLHPAFYDAQGNEIDYILMGAYEGSIFDVSANTYILDDAQVMDATSDLFCSIAGAKPASGKTQDLTRPKLNQMCTNRGMGWYSDNIKATSANQMLMIIEMGMMNMQTAIGQGVVSVADNPNTENNSKVTGGTSALGNGTGQATGTSEQVSISYRGYENPWGNIWKFIYGVNIWGDGTLGGGVPYYATDFNFAESKRTDNYVSAGFSCANAGGYISAIGYSPECDWMFIGSEVLGNSSVPVGDYQWTTENLNDYRIALLGGRWSGGTVAGAFYWTLNNGVGARDRCIGGRLVYVPTATA